MRKNYLLLLLLMWATICHAQLMEQKITLHRGVSLIQDDCGYTIKYRLGEYQITKDTVNAEEGDYIFSSIEFYDDYYDRLDEYGFPSLPFFGVNLRVPDPDVNVNVKITDIQTFEIQLERDFIPAQMYGPTLSHLDYDDAYYNHDNHTWYWNEYDWDLYVMPRNYGLNFTIYPFHYEPSTRTLTIVKSATYRIDIEGCGLEKLLDDDNVIGRTVFDNYIGSAIDLSTESAVKQLVDGAIYLIIANDKLKGEELDKFINHKLSKGYQVDVRYCSNDTPADIIHFLEEYYKDKPDLLYVLLVGTPDLIPFSAGVKDDRTNPPTDLEYVLLPSLNKKLSKFNYAYFLGRWPVESTEELKNIVDKTIKNENALANFSPSRVSIFSGAGDHKNYTYNNAHYIANLVNGINGIYPYLYDGRKVSKNDAYKDMTCELSGQHDACPWIFTYFGHGGKQLIGEPYKFDYNGIANASNSSLDYQPFGFAFTCWLGNTYYCNNFTRHWIHNENGGVTMLSSTTISYDPPNRYFSRNTFSQLENKINRSIGLFVYGGMQKFYTKCKTEPRWRTVRRYNLYGDPSLYLWGINWATGRPKQVAKERNEDASEISVIKDDKVIYINQESCRVQLFTVNGICIFDECTNTIQTNNIASGLYIIKITTNGILHSDKIYIQ